MAGHQHSYPTGFPVSQPNTMRTQFGGNAMVTAMNSGLMAPQQNLVASQQYGGGMVPGAGTNSLGMLNAQQALQQQQMQHQLQQQQLHQQQLQLQQHQLQQQPSNLVQQNTPNNDQSQQMPMTQVQTVAQKPANRDFNTATLCRLGQEAVQEIVSRMQELFQTLKVLHPPNGTAQASSISNERKLKVQDQIRMLTMLFKRLKIIYEKCNENCQLQGMEYTHTESLIPLKEEWDMKSDEKKTSETYKSVWEENNEAIEQVILKNRQLKELIDHLRHIVLEINTMMSMRRS